MNKQQLNKLLEDLTVTSFSALTSRSHLGDSRLTIDRRNSLLNELNLKADLIIKNFENGMSPGSENKLDISSELVEDYLQRTKSPTWKLGRIYRMQMEKFYAVLGTSVHEVANNISKDNWLVCDIRFDLVIENLESFLLRDWLHAHSSMSMWNIMLKSSRRFRSMSKIGSTYLNISELRTSFDRVIGIDKSYFSDNEYNLAREWVTYQPFAELVYLEYLMGVLAD